MDMWQQQLNQANTSNGFLGVNLANSKPIQIDPQNPESVQNALQENMNLKQIASKMQSNLENAINKNGELQEELAAVKSKLGESQTSLKDFQLVFREMQIDYEKQKQITQNFNNTKNLKDQEIQELSKELKMVQEQNAHLQGQMKNTMNQLHHDDHDIVSLRQKLEQGEKRAETFREKLSKKNEEVQDLNEKYNTAQARYFTINQEYESLKQSTSREIQLLQTNLKSSQQQNKVIIKLKLEAEERLKELQMNGGGIVNEKLQHELIS